MAVNIQIILPFVYLVFAEGRYVDPFTPNFDITNLFPMRDDVKQRAVNDNPKNSGIFSYNYENNYGNSNIDGYNIPLDPYFSYPRSLQNPNFDNMPLPNFSWGNNQNKFDSGIIPPNQSDNKMNTVKTPVEDSENNHDTSLTQNIDRKKDQPEDNDDATTPENNDYKKDNVENSDQTSNTSGSESSSPDSSLKSKTEDAPPKTNENSDSKVALSANKDYLLVDDTGNAYLLYEHTPNRVVSNNNQQATNNVVYVPVTPNKNAVQPNNNQGYQLFNGQPSISINNPVTGNTPNSAVPMNYQTTTPNVIYVNAPNTNNPQQVGNQVYQVINGQLVPANFPFTSNGLNVVQQPGNQAYQTVNGQPIISTNTPFTTTNNAVPVNYQTAAPKVVQYVPAPITNNQPQLGNQMYQVVNGQPSSTNNQFSNVIMNPVQSNPLTQNNNPSYVLIYANGQWIQIPGIPISSQQNIVPTQNSNNAIFTQSVPNNNAQNGYSPTLMQPPNTNIPVSNTITTSPNTNLGYYSVPNSNVQPNVVSNYNQGSTLYAQNPNSAVPINNPAGNNVNTNQQSYTMPKKEASLEVSNPNNSFTTSDQAKTTGNNYIEAQPAVMFSGFKEKEEEKQDNKETNNNDIKEDFTAKEKDES